MPPNTPLYWDTKSGISYGPFNYPLSLDLLSIHTRLPSFGTRYKAMSQGRHSSLSFTKESKRGAGSTQRGKFFIQWGNGWWKWLGEEKFLPPLSPPRSISRCSSFTPLHRPRMSERVTRFCLCDSLWSCTQTDGYDFVDIALSLSFPLSHSQGPRVLYIPQQSDNPLILYLRLSEDPVEALGSRIFLLS